MELELCYPVFVIIRDPDLMPFTIRRSTDGIVAFPVLETAAQALRLIAKEGTKDAAAIRIHSPSELLGSLRMAAKLAKVNAIVLLLRGTSPGRDDLWHVFPLPIVLEFVAEQIERAKKAGSN